MPAVAVSSLREPNLQPCLLPWPTMQRTPFIICILKTYLRAHLFQSRVESELLRQAGLQSKCLQCQRSIVLEGTWPREYLGLRHPNWLLSVHEKEYQSTSHPACTAWNSSQNLVYCCLNCHSQRLTKLLNVGQRHRLSQSSSIWHAKAALPFLWKTKVSACRFGWFLGFSLLEGSQLHSHF